MKKKLLRGISFILILSVLGSCQSVSDDFFVYNIRESLKVDMREELGVERKFKLNFETTEVYNCSNFSLLTTLNDEDNLAIRITEVLEPSMCQEGLAPALGSQAIPSLSEGSYDLSISILGAVVNQGTLEMSEEQYTLTFAETTGISLLRNALNRVPENTIWGKLDFTPENNEDLEEYLEDLLDNLNTESDSYIQGDYGYFKIDEEDELQILNDSSNSFESQHTFIRGLDEANFAELANIVNDFNAQYQGEAKLTIYTDNGDIFE